MRDYIRLYINGKFYKISGESAFLPLSEYLRNSLFFTGTKESCTEGDCGACTVLLGKIKDDKISYAPVNSCIIYLYQLDNAHIITIEGLKYKDNLNPVQEAIVNHHGTQCGFCTPGVVTTLYSLFDCGCKDDKPDRGDIQHALSGNLCRCTGYDSIIHAGLTVNPCSVRKLNELYPPDKLYEILEPQCSAIRLLLNNREFIQPANLQEALCLKSEKPDAVLISGGTDIHVLCNKRDFEPETIIHLANIQELNNINLEDNRVLVGAAVTISKFESYISEIFPELSKLFEVFASPQIKNIATLAGNIANGSPVGDTIPFLMVMNAKLTLTGSDSVRTININNFYKGYKDFNIEPNEIITQINIPILNSTEVLKLYKVSKRKHLDISSFSAAVRIQEKDGIIESIAIAFGGVGPTVQRVHNIESFLIGKKFSQESFEGAAALIKSSIKPICDVRGSENFRMQLAENCLKRFYFEIKDQENSTCQL
ncbi:MAG: hypothetical protein ACD_20C00347G0008 [uncultured bacterium]|nr:MAG: hypothetical protein ACD_20C00347G0008 [uncultured bacterium]